MAVIGQTRPTPGVNPTTIRTPLLILGVALALVAFLAMFAFGLLFANKTGGGAQIKVVIAARDIAAREPITATPDMVTVVNWPQSGAPAQALTSASQVTGTSALVNIPKGQPITANVVASNPDQLTQSAYLPIPSGYVAMEIATTEIQGVGGRIAQGDYIDVMASLTTGLFNAAHPVPVNETVFTQVYVLRVGPQSTASGQGQTQGVTSSLTILITQCDAQYLVWLLQNGTLIYTLSSYQDYSKLPPQPTTRCDPKVAAGRIGPAEINTRWGFYKG